MDVRCTKANYGPGEIEDNSLSNYDMFEKLANVALEEA